VFWDNTPCSVITIYPRIGRTWRINIPPKRGRIFLKGSNVKGKGKGKVHPITGNEGPEVEYRYSSTLSLTSELDGVRGQRHAPAALPPRKTRYPLYRRLGGPQGRSGRVTKISPLPGLDPRTVQPDLTLQ
jgi:hypothetical protein